MKQPAQNTKLSFRCLYIHYSMVLCFYAGGSQHGFDQGYDRCHIVIHIYIFSGTVFNVKYPSVVDISNILELRHFKC